MIQDIKFKMTKKFRIKKKFNGMTILSIKNFKDHRGDFLKLFSSLELDNLILNKKIKQVNFVSTKKKGLFVVFTFR